MDGKILKIYLTIKTENKSNSPAGTLMKEGKKLFVNTNDNMLEILELQLEGKKRVKAIDFLNGMDFSKEHRCV